MRTVKKATPAPPSQRSNYATLIVGRKHTGKSTKAARMIEQYVTEPKPSRPGRRALVVDVNGSPAYAGLPLLTPDQVAAWKPDARLRAARVRADEPMALLTAVGKLRHALVVLEDCTKWIPSTLPPAIKALLTDHRMRDMDLVFTFHSLCRVPPQYWEMTSHVVLLKTQDSPDSVARRRIIPNLDKVKAAWERVQAHRDEYASEVVETLI